MLSAAVCVLGVCVLVFIFSEGIVPELMDNKRKAEVLLAADSARQRKAIRDELNVDVLLQKARELLFSGNPESQKLGDDLMNLFGHPVRICFGSS